MSSSEANGGDAGQAIARLEAAALALASAAREVLAAGAASGVSDEALQHILTAGTRLFARKVEAEQRDVAPFAPSDVATPTEAVTVMGAMLHTVNLSAFDLSMWVDGRPRP